MRARELPVVLALSSNNEHGTARVLHHPRRNAPEENPGNGAQPFGPHHNQIGLVFGGYFHDGFSRPPKLIHRLGRKPRLDQLPHAPFDRLRPIPISSGLQLSGSTWITLT